MSSTPPNLKIVFNSNLLEVSAQVIAQQCNCTSKRTRGLSAAIAKKYPYANFYSRRTETSEPGTIELRGKKRKNQRYVLALYAQYYPGKPKANDTSGDRIMWFNKCLHRISKIKNLRSIAFPSGIGCGLAGGEWNVYQRLIEEWTETIPNIKVYIISLEPSTVIKDEECISSDWKITELVDCIQSSAPRGWEDFFHNLPRKKLQNLSKFLHKEAQETTLHPPITDVFKAFELCPLKKIKVIIIGQDPYHSPGAAMGVAFGHHSERKKIQPSLRKIYQALENDGYKADWESGNLSNWCAQGVLLINTALTVREGKAGSHASTSSKPGPWHFFIDTLFEYLDRTSDHLVVMMWGAKAQKYRKYFSQEKHLHIEAPHPAASVYNPKNTEFFDHKPFSSANRQLKKWKIKTIDWNLG